MGKGERSRGNGMSLCSSLVIVVALLLLCSTNLEPPIGAAASTESSTYSCPSPQIKERPPRQSTPPGLPHDPIVITSDFDFQGWPGSGTLADPYRIQNLTIEAATADQSCIDISNTRVHFIVTQCSFSGATAVSNTSGITLSNVHNAQLDNNTFLLATYGIFIRSSSSTTVVNSFFQEQRTAAVTLIWSNSCIVENNTFPTSVDAISLQHSRRCRVAGNSCKSSHYAIGLEESDTNMVFNNTCVDATCAIRIESSSENNTVADNTNVNCHVGISFSWSNANRAIYNLCINSTGGIALEGSEFCLVANNTFTNLTGGGVEAVESNHCLISNNTLTGLTSGGIEVSASENCTMVGNTLTKAKEGIYLRWSVFGTIVDNLVITCTYGISLFESNASTAQNNTLLGCGFSVSGDTIPGCRQASLNNNTVNGHPVIFWQDRVGGIVPAGAGQVILVNCTGVAVKDQILANSTVGIQLSFCNDTSLVGNTCTDNRDGISLRLSRFNALSANLLARNHQGIFLYKSSNNSIRLQICTRNDIGIRLAWWSSNNTLMESTCTEGWQGIVLEYESSGNRILRNILSANAYNAYDIAPDNIFDYNYWSDYWGFDLDQDGIGDIPYVVPPTLMGSFDPHPLMSPPGTTPTFGVREAYWLAVFLSPVVSLAVLVGFSAWLYRRRRLLRAARVRRRRTRRTASS